MTADERSVELTVRAARAAADKKARQVIALDVSERLVLTDVFLVTSGSSERQVKAIVDGIEDAMHEVGVKALRKEGVSEARWVLLDYGDIVVHVQHDEDREFYALERLWKDCPVVELPEDVVTAPGPDERDDDENDDLSRWAARG